MHHTAHLISQREVWRFLANLHSSPDAEARKAWALSAERGTGWPVQLPKRQRAHVHTDETFATGVGVDELARPLRGFLADRLYRGP